MYKGKRILINPVDDYKGDIFVMIVNRVGTLHEKAGCVEYKIPYAMAKAYLSMRKESEKKLHPLAYLTNVVNEEFGLKGQCVKVIQY